jgi:hypothetical protein
MFYNYNDNIIVSRLPKNLLKFDGTLFINFNISDAHTLADYGFYTIRNDNNLAPTPEYIEDIKKREILFDKPYADINRIWVLKNSEDT